MVKSGSMEPTLMTNDIVIFNQLAHVFSPVERGNIVIFWSEE
ncbi:MAG: S26 family signal peptidase [Lachnospiraceae bacterium]